MKVTVTQAQEQITTIANDVYSTYLKGSYDNFEKKYNDVKDGAKQTFTKENAEKIPGRYKEWGGKAYGFIASKFSSSEDDQKSDDNQTLRDKLENINYYAFQYAAITTQVLQKIHVILTDTLTEIVKEQTGKSTADLISAQKIKAIYDSTEIKEIAVGLAASYVKFPSLFSQITGQQVSEAIKVMFATDTNSITEHLTKIKTNVTSLQSKSDSDINNTEQLLKFIFVGENAEATIKNAASGAKGLVEEEQVKKLLEELLDSNTVNSLSDVLKGISGSSEAESATQ